MGEAQPSYVCLGPDGYLDHHEQGTVLFANANVTALGCKRCGVVYWERPAPSHQTPDWQCQGITQRGRRCSLPAEYGGFCGHHRGQKPPDSGHL